ncbi:RNA/RNP complex-1-interacting phosphatase-like [Cheilinus undulatus]|uniref:RNA/RNP complex-1-interacting phosphatase-like n=1 Tax=Cheilinus undulatus TaxID=241271 RepID=UPI001BD6C87E|nr:RNA/RNP complex-1-interacting phosphatase-like [Cheilinus undulatus]
MSGHKKKNGIPDRWLDYKAVGKRLHGTRFIAFKVPLKQSLICQLPSRDVFGPWELLDALSEENQELGLIIDLTFTTRYYKLQDLPESLMFVKILTAGHEVPSDKTILSFKRAVRNFLRENADNDKLIGVHCTHGLNRTGYLICRYLIDVDGMDPKEAVQLFNSSRGHDIERQNYLEDLQSGPKRSNDGMEESEQEPMKGLASHRPLDSDGQDEGRPHPESQRLASRRPLDSDDQDERPPHFKSRRLASRRPLDPGGQDERRPHSESRRHRNRKKRERNPRSTSNGLLPYPPPPFCPPMGASFNPYQWTAPHLDSQWSRPPQFEESRPRYPDRDWERRSSSHWQQDSWKAPPPPPVLPQYSPLWANESNGHDGRKEEEWDAPRSRHHYRQAHRGRDPPYGGL